MAADVPPLTRAPLSWRVGYALLASQSMRRATAGGLRGIKALFGAAAAEWLLNRLAATIAWSGWPRHTRGWVNLHATSFYWQMVQALAQPRRVVAARAAKPRTPIRVGCFGAFSGLLSFQRRFFAAKPDDVELVVYDVPYDGGDAAYLRPLVDEYRAVRFDSGGDAVGELARTIAADDLDLLINVHAKRETHDLFDRVDVPCIVNVCTGSDLLHHDRVSFQIYPQPEADFFPVDGRMFCAVTQRPVGGYAAYPGWILYDPRDIDVDAVLVPWRKREPLIVCHGSLYKMSSAPFLDVIFDLLAADPALEFVFIGPDGRGGLKAIESHAARRGMSARTHYQGVFSHLRGRDGEIESPGWRDLCDLLQRARLAPDPWPVGGASARFEAYLLGTPTVHMGLRTDPLAWGQPQAAIIDIPALRVPSGTALNAAEYRRLCERALYKEAFADALAAEQQEVARSVGDPDRYWRLLLGYHEHWLEGRTAATALADA